MFLNDFLKLAPKIKINSLSFSTKTVKPGSVFFAVPGQRHNGHDFIDKAIAKGAVCVVHQESISTYRQGVVYVKCDNVLHLMAKFSSFFYQHPSQQLRLIGITGTNGKTTTAKLIQELRQHSTKCGYIGTLGLVSSQTQEECGLTTPDVITLHRWLQTLVQEQVSECVIEVSSHALKLQRVVDLQFHQRLFTNFSQDHLDFHTDMEDYFQTKMTFFQGMKSEDVAIINLDDPRSAEAITCIPEGCRVLTVGLNNHADFVILSDWKLGWDKTCFKFRHQQQEYTVHSTLLGEHNIYNLMLAIVSLFADGYALEWIVEQCAQLQGVAGRMVSVNNPLGLKIIIDYAHTPVALEKIYRFVQKTVPRGKIVSVFGSAGGRDRSKRRILGEISEKYCRQIILTADDPRTESPMEICKQIRKGIKKCRTTVIEDREQAITEAILQSGPQDVIVITGKGVEDFMYVGKGRVPYLGDHQIVERAIEKLVQERKKPREH